MKLLWEAELPDKRGVPGTLYLEAGKLLYVFLEREAGRTENCPFYDNYIRIYEYNKQDGGRVQLCGEPFVPLYDPFGASERAAFHDQFVLWEGKLYYYSKQSELFMDLQGNFRTPEELSAVLKPFSNPEVEPFHFGDRTVRMRSPFVLECKNRENGARLWEIRMHQYLGTPIQQKDGYLFWGTAGKGGAFYSAALEDGQYSLIKTGGTVSYGWFQDRIYTPDDRGRLLKIDPYACVIQEELRLPMTGTDLCGDRLFTEEDRLYMTLYRRRDEKYHLVCIQL